jgi:glycosyltransferase involved in cell wall biosynthesis
MIPKTIIAHLRCASGGGGGADRVIYNTVRRLQDGPFGQTVLYLVNEGTDVSGLLDPLRQQGVLCHVMPGRRVFDLRQFLSVRRFVLKHKVRILHCHDAKADIYGFLLRLTYPSLKVISTLHGWTEKTRRGRLYGRLDKTVLRWFDVAIAVSEHTARLAREHGIQRVRVVHNGLDPEEWRTAPAMEPRPGSHPFTIAYVGRISSEKGPLEFVEIARVVILQQPDIRFVVLGEGPDLPAMKTAVEAAGLGENFDFRGYQTQEELKKVYRAVDVLVLPSRREGLPMTILEACSMEVCVAAFSVGGVPEIITHGRNGLLAQPGNIAELAAQILALRQDALLSARLRSNGRATVVNRFSVQAQVRELEAVYADTLRDDRRNKLNRGIST